MRMDYRNIIKGDVDWLFDNFGLQRMELSKSVDEEWDYVVKLKMGAGIGRPLTSTKTDETKIDYIKCYLPNPCESLSRGMYCSDECKIEGCVRDSLEPTKITEEEQ